jgi:beta-lactamase superfamily II metal-dependent hydrolase
MTVSTSAEIRMYRLNELGDCFLIIFSHGDHKSRLLIDCGSFRNSGPSVKRLGEITEAIDAEVGDASLDVVVGTHQHNDHLSGFVHCKAAFRQIGVDQVWLSWLDDPQDGMAREIGEAHHNLTLQLAAVRERLAESPVSTRGLRSFDVLTDVLGFYGWSAAGTPPEIPAKGVAILREIGKKPPLFLRPGRTLELPGLPAGTVRVYVLGPPRIPGNELLRRADPRAGESYDVALASANAQATKFLEAINLRVGEMSREEQQYPFSEPNKYRDAKGASPALVEIRKRYNQRDGRWRRIDNAWLDQAGALALYLNSLTNNSSLALAIELVDSGKVLLFAGDAQIGNWLSWQEVPWKDQSVDTDDLLARTVFYKVGHHASHNATLVAALEKMNSPELVAMIPVHKQDPNITKKNGWRMPATNLFNRLTEKTNNRVLQMDGDNPRACDPVKSPAKEAWKRINVKPRTTPTEIRLTIGG